MNEYRRISPERGEQLREQLEARYGGPSLDQVDVGEDGAVSERETWGDGPTTTTRRIPKEPPK